MQSSQTNFSNFYDNIIRNKVKYREQENKIKERKRLNILYKNVPGETYFEEKRLITLQLTTVPNDHAIDTLRLAISILTLISYFDHIRHRYL